MESSVKMPLVTRDRNKALICFNGKRISIDGHYRWTYDSAWTTFPFDRGTIISDIIRSKYTANQVEAIILNGEDTEEHAEELANLQAWRKTAKDIADQVLNANME